MKKLMLAASVCAVLGLASPAYAASFTLHDYTIDDYDEVGSGGLDIQTEKILGQDFSFSLNVGQSTSWIDLFSIATDEESINLEDDFNEQDIFVTFDFSQPLPGFGGDAEGTTVGRWFFFSWGEVNWDAPALLAFGTTGLLQITLSNETFGLDTVPGGRSSGTVQAKFKLLQDDTPAPVPEPGTLALLGAGLAAAGARLRSRRRTQQS